MRSFFVVIDPPFFDYFPRFVQRREDVLVEAFLAKPSVEALDERVLVRLAGADEVDLHPVLERPRVYRLAVELGPVVDRNRVRAAALLQQAVEHPNHPNAAQRGVHLDGGAFPRERILDRQRPELPA